MKTEGGQGRGGLREKKKSAFAGLFAIFPLLFLASNNHPFFPRYVVSFSVIFRAKVHISSVPCLETEKGDQKKSTKGTQRAPREWLAQQIIVVIAREKKKKKNSDLGDDVVVVGHVCTASRTAVDLGAI